MTPALLLAVRCGWGRRVELGGGELGVGALDCSAGALGTDTAARLLISHRGESAAASRAANALALSHH